METAKKPSTIQWVVFVVFVPLVFALLLSGVVLQVLGVPVIGKLKALTTTTHSYQAVITQSSQKHVPTVQDQLNQQTDLVNQMKQQNNSLKSQIIDQQQQIDLLKQQYHQSQTETNAAKQQAQSYDAQAKLIAAMSPDQAAKVIQALPQANAMQILSRLNQDSEAAILEKMDAQVAAQYLAKLIH